MAIRLVRSDATQAGLDKAQASLSSATASGLAVIERASAKVRQQLTTPVADAASAKPAARSTARKTRSTATQAVAKSTAKAPAKAPAKRRSSAKPAPAADKAAR
ncbi:MAG: hypothetical protein C0451_09625 [Comamonadaceae bacterium]|nr:hypothetical protein [Comamonadaceae bacterium]